MNKYTLYAYFENATEECLYIGIAKGNGEERHANHLKPSKRDIQKINIYLQDNPDAWTYVILGTINLQVDAKEAIHALETFFVNKYNPSLNVYKIMED